MSAGGGWSRLVDAAPVGIILFVLRAAVTLLRAETEGYVVGSHGYGTALFRARAVLKRNTRIF